MNEKEHKRKNNCNLNLFIIYGSYTVIRSTLSLGTSILNRTISNVGVDGPKARRITLVYVERRKNPKVISKHYLPFDLPSEEGFNTNIL